MRQPGTPAHLHSAKARYNAKSRMRIGTDIDNVEMVTADDGGRIPAQYQEFVEMFRKTTDK